MRERRLPSVFFLYLGLAMLQPALLVLVGALRHLNTRGTWFMVVVVLALACRSRIAWALLIALNAIPLLASVGLAFGGQVEWAHLAVIVLTGVALEATLLSAAMRQYLGGARNGVDISVPSL